MLELLFCSMLTLLPDYLFRRYVQGKRIGQEITLYSVWFELRWGLVTCVLLTVSLITAVFFFHPSTTSAAAVFRSVPILPDTIGRVAEVYVRGSQPVEAGQPLFRIDDRSQRTAVERAQREVAEVDSAFALARADLAQAEAKLLEAQWQQQQAIDEFETKRELARTEVAARREVERLAVLVRSREAASAAAAAAKAAVEARIAEQLPAERASAEAALQQAEAELSKTVVRAGVDGRVEQFTLQVGDVVNPMLRPAGVLVPEDRGIRRLSLVAGFGQIEASVLRPGMPAEAVCVSRPWVVIPMVVTQVQGFIASGQIRGSDQLIDLQQLRQPGNVLVTLEPLYAGGLDGVVPGSSCIANAYSWNHDALHEPDVGVGRFIVLHAIDTIGLVHAILLRIQALLMPFKLLVFSGGH
jgi:multidrug resistance efflux pump